MNLGAQISALKAYPYGCLEQTASGLYPSLYADDALLKRLSIKGESDAERKRKIEIGIERLLGMQRYNGSFGLWGADGEEEYWLTAYVTDFLLRARDQGFAVPPEALLRSWVDRYGLAANWSDSVNKRSSRLPLARSFSSSKARIIA